MPCREHQILISFLPLFLEVWEDNSRKAEVESKPIIEEATTYKGEMDFAENELQAFGSSLWKHASEVEPHMELRPLPHLVQRDLMTLLAWVSLTLRKVHTVAESRGP